MGGTAFSQGLWAVVQRVQVGSSRGQTVLNMKRSEIKQRRRAQRAAGLGVTVVLLAACASHAHPAPQTAVPSRPATSSPTRPPTKELPRPTSPVAPPPLPSQVADAFALSRRADSDLAVATLRGPAGPGQGPVTVLQLDPSRTRLILHAGSAEPAPSLTWQHGPLISSVERSGLVAVLNGGFKLRDSRGGWRSEGRTVAPLVFGAASVVIYADGGTDIGTWGQDVPRAGRPIASVRQNLELLIDRGRPQRTQSVAQPLLNQWWGRAFREQYLISRSALGVTASGMLVWAAGTKITVAALAAALLAHGVVRALELDVNAPLVRGFLFPGAAGVSVTAGGQPVTTALPLVTGQTQTVVSPSVAPHCTYLIACSRDFFTVLTR